MIEDGGPAFPLPDAEPGFQCSAKGMSLRDYLAAAVLIQPDVKFASIFSNKWAAWMAYKRADVMLAERRKAIRENSCPPPWLSDSEKQS